MERIFKDSVYRFTDPIRYFKANDPYYWEVDNIPLKQLAENTQWLKDQIVGGIKNIKVTRADIDELRPFVEGTNNVIKVKPGRFSARINDAYDLTPLQRITQLLGESVGEFNVWVADTTNNTQMTAILDRIKSTLAIDSLNLNGLSERAFTYPIKNSDFVATDYIQASPTTTGLVGLKKPIFPISEVLGWCKATSETDYIIQTYSQNLEHGFIGLANAESTFIKRWRGIARIAIVDVPYELEIDVLPFNPNEHFYKDERGLEMWLPATKRIDLLFIYSKPVDTSSTTIAKYAGNSTPTKITQPQLGILHGAGVGINFHYKTSVNQFEGESAFINTDGRTGMISHPADENSTTNGFLASSIHGSFPAPDDLMNLAPALSEKLAATNYALIGQTILPIAYIVVNQGAPVNAQGKFVLQDTNIIDIRPFFRTTELAYNERAGIAAAIPALSLANPAVGKAQLDVELKNVYDDLSAKLNAKNSTPEPLPRVVGAGYLMGGMNFGVEGAYADFLKSVFGQSTSNARLKQEIVTRWGLPTDIVIPDLPDWDLAKWCLQSSLTEKGSYPNDRINVHAKSGGATDYGVYSDKALATKVRGFGTDNSFGIDNLVNIQYARKVINIDRTKVPWMKDYIVQANFLNCVPLSTRATTFQGETAAGAQGIWIEKRQNQFVIYCAWVANDQFPSKNAGTEKKLIPGGNFFETYPNNNREGHWYAGFMVTNLDMVDAANSDQTFGGVSQAGVAIYPSITFQVIGIPNNFSGYGINLNSVNPNLILG